MSFKDIQIYFQNFLFLARLSSIVVKDLIDQKGISHPDIGSIIAYAISSSEYDNKYRKLREMSFSNEISSSRYSQFIFYFYRYFFCFIYGTWK